MTYVVPLFVLLLSLPTTEWREEFRTVWDELADCESGEWIDNNGTFVQGSADWSAEGGIFQGGLQFHPVTWGAYRPTDFPKAASAATREQEIYVAELVLADQGWEAWPTCSRLLGLRD